MIRNWHKDFTKKNRAFDVRVAKKHKLPPFLDENRYEMQQIRQYAKKNLPQLSIEMLSEYIHDTVVPLMVRERYGAENNDPEKYDESVARLMQEHGLKKICPSTIYGWMKLLGFKYEPRKKGYYVDGHEKPATIEYCNSFVKRYLTYERQMYRWIQLTAEESKEMEIKGLVTPNSGYKYKNKEGDNMVEYHVDSAKTWDEKLTKETRFGGYLSVR